MIRATILAGSLFFGGVTGALVGQATSADSYWDSIVGSAIGGSGGAAVMAWRLNKRDKEVDALQKKLEDAHERTIQVVERAIPILAEATRTLAEVRTGLEATVRKVPADDIARAVGQLETLVEDLARGRGRE